MHSRRNFLKRTATAMMGVSAAGTLSRMGLLNAMSSQGGGYRALVCVFLFGGNDSNNMVIPFDSNGFSEYTKLRQNLALAQSSLLPIQTASNGVYALHPSLPDFQKMFAAKQLAVVANVGSLVAPLSRAQYIANQGKIPDNLFSHLDQQTQWQTSVANGFTTTGWAGRVADQVAYLNSPATFPTFVSVAGNALLGSGAQTRPGSVTPGVTPGLTGFNTTAAALARENSLQQLLTFDSGVTLVHQAANTMNNGLADAATLTKALNGATALTTVFPKTSLGAQLNQVAKLIQVRQTMGMNRQIFFASLGSFDTHTNQLTDQDTLFQQLGPALSAFVTATQELGVDQQVTAFTESDFSRTMQPNTNGGTDHAWGSHQIVVGGAVKGGDLYGQYPSLVLNGSNDAGGEGRWIPTTSIDQYGATLAQWFGVSPQNLSTVFPNIVNFSSNNVGFLG